MAFTRFHEWTPASANLLLFEHRGGVKTEASICDMFPMMKDTIFSYSFFGVGFGCWSTRPTMALVIADDFKDVMARGKLIKTFTAI